MELTLFELHLDEASFAANAPFASTGGEADEDVAGSESTQSGEGGGPSPVAFVVGLLFLVGVAVAVRRKLRGGDDSAELEEEPTVDTVSA